MTQRARQPKKAARFVRLRATKEELERELAIFYDNVVRRQGELRGLDTLIAKRRKVMTATDGKHRAVLQRLYDLSERSTKLAGAIRELEDSHRIKLSGRFEELDASLARKDEEIAEKERKLATLNHSLAEQESVLASRRAEGRMLDGVLDKREEGLSKILREIKRLRKEVSDLEEQKGRLAEVEKQIDAADIKHLVLVERLSTLGVEIGTAERELDGIEKRIGERLSACTRKEKKLAALSASLFLKEKAQQKREKRLENLARVLQEHYDKQGMPIRVFNTK